MLPSEVKLIQDLRRKYQNRAHVVRKDRPADVTKSEIVRAALAVLKGLSSEEIFEAVEGVPELKEGRPMKGRAGKR